MWCFIMKLKGNQNLPKQIVGKMGEMSSKLIEQIAEPQNPKFLTEQIRLKGQGFIEKFKLDLRWVSPELLKNLPLLKEKRRKAIRAKVLSQLLEQFQEDEIVDAVTDYLLDFLATKDPRSLKN